MSTQQPARPVIKFLVGERVYLRPLERDDLDVFCRWANDPVSRNLTGDLVPYSTTQLTSWFDRVAPDETRMRFMICLGEDDARIGTIALLSINRLVRSAKLDVAIGEKKRWGKGYATESIRLMLEYAYGTLGLHRLQVDVFAFNTRAASIYERLGFRHEGVLREGHWFDHRFEDVLVMGLLEQEYRERYRPGTA